MVIYKDSWLVINMVIYKDSYKYGFSNRDVSLQDIISSVRECYILEYT